MYIETVVQGKGERVYTYLVPERFREKARLYQRVRVPFGEENGLTALITGFSETPEIDRIREIERIVDDEPVLNQEQFHLAEQISHLYYCSLGDALFLMLPAGVRARENPEGQPQENENILPPLTQEQSEALSHLKEKKSLGALYKYLLWGITGSGKTRVYLELIRHYLDHGEGVILLLPEIALSYQFVSRLKPLFGNKMATLHSRLAISERMAEYRRIMSGEAPLVVGTRSASFAPVKNLSLIIIDEEHDTSYKENRSPYYHARTIAFLRLQSRAGKESTLPLRLLLGSATPSLESYYLAQSGYYQLLRLKERATGISMPKTEVYHYSITNSLLSPYLRKKMSQHLDNGKQVILLLNRRGYKNYAICRSCGEVQTCPRCSVSLTYHKDQTLRCHLCGHSEPYSGACHSCRGKLELHGEGTQKLEDELDHFFPGIEYARMDQDSARDREYTEDVISATMAQKVRILFGTQMIAKGFDLPGVTFVGILNADSGLFTSDFRGVERTFQLINQASGRAGRHEAGEVLIQTEAPPHWAIRYAAEEKYAEFAANELSLREQLGYPPFRRLIRILVKGKDEKAVSRLAHDIVASFDAESSSLFFEQKERDVKSDIEILGPAEAPVSKASEEWRWHILLKCHELQTLQKETQQLYEKLKSGHIKNHGASVFIDPEPLDLS